MIYKKGTLIKAKAENRDRVVTRNISYFRRISKDTGFPKSTSTSDESDNDFEYTKHYNSDTRSHNNKHYPSHKRPCRYGTEFED